MTLTKLHMNRQRLLTFLLLIILATKVFAQPQPITPVPASNIYPATITDANQRQIVIVFTEDILCLLFRRTQGWQQY